MITVAAAASTTVPSSLPWVLVSVLVGLVVALVGFYGSQKPHPAGLNLGFYPALFLAAGGFVVASCACLALFNYLHLL